MSAPLLEAKGLVKHFPVDGGLFSRSRGAVHAVDDVSVSVKAGETAACVGESGCGKSTLGRLLMRLIEPDRGSVVFDGVDILGLTGPELRRKKRDMQIIFQDPYASLNPRMRILDIIGEPLDAQSELRGKEREEAVGQLLDMVGLSREWMWRYPHMFSGGQRQRIGIARALALDPKFLVCDEPVSALDVSIQSQIVNLLLDLREKKNLSYFFISHDLNLVRHIADSVTVMFLGKVMERGPVAEVYSKPLHPYSMFLVQAAPRPDPRTRMADKPVLKGEIPSPVDPPSGCRFRTRCPFAAARCAEEEPALVVNGDRAVACHFPLG